MTHIHWTKVLTTIAGLLMVGSLAMGQSKTRLQVTVTPERAKADELARQLNSLGYGPSQVRPFGSQYQVVTKLYDTLGEANLVKPYLLGQGFMETVAVADGADQSPVSDKTVFGAAPSVAPGLMAAQIQLDLDKTKRTTAASEVDPSLRQLDNASASEEDLLKKAVAFSKLKDADEALAAIDAFVQRFKQSQHVPNLKLKRAYWLVAKKDDKSATEQFQAIIRDYPGTVEAGEAQLRNGYLAIRLKKPEVEVLQQFRKLANGEVACKPEVRIEAMLRCAALYHKAKDLDTAEAAYLAICGATAEAEIKAFAQMQIAAITLEKAWDNRATFEQARTVCEQVLAAYPQVNIHTRATAALMAIETLAYEKNYAQVLAREASYMQAYGQTVEAQLAYYWFALAHLETGDTASAKGIVQALLEAKFPTAERFNLVDVTASARKLQKRIEEAEQLKK